MLVKLARLTRDLLVVNVDPSRAADPEIAADAERDRLVTLASRFSTEDLMRAFEVLTKAESDIRGSAHPRYHLEMALLRWIHLRKLVPISDLIRGIEKGTPIQPARGPLAAGSATAARPAAPAPRAPSANAAIVKAVEARQESSARGTAALPAAPSPAQSSTPVAPGDLKDAFLEEIRTTKKYFYGTVVAQAHRIDVESDRVVFTFAPAQRSLRVQFDQSRTQLEALASQLSGRRMAVVSVEGGAATPAAGAAAAPAAPAVDRQAELRQQALSDSGVQAMLDVFAAEIKDVEEM